MSSRRSSRAKFLRPPLAIPSCNGYARSIKWPTYASPACIKNSATSQSSWTKSAISENRRMTRTNDLRRLHFINTLFARVTGHDLYLAQQIKDAIAFSLTELEQQTAEHPELAQK